MISRTSALGMALAVALPAAAAPAAIGQRLAACGYGGSSVWVMEHLAGAAERIVRTTASELEQRPFADLNLMAIELVASAMLPPPA